MRVPLKTDPKKIALAAMGAAISLIFVLISFWVQKMTLSLNVIAACGMMLPLIKKYYRESIIAYAVVVLIGALLTNIHILPFALVTGAYTIAAIIFHEKKVKAYVFFPIIIIYSSLVFYILYALTKLLIIDFSKTNIANLSTTFIYIIFNIIFIIVFIIYHFSIIYTYKFISSRLNTANSN
ncbi:MAG: hypothetical protein LBF68_00880 [Christensenellaceae bacterium]|jgi:hypothetical protein|nr:hypothetical protein [Christensenellaceae bacterium]